jgi:hypothetical protein
MITQLSRRARILWIGVPSALAVLCLAGMFYFNHEPPPFNTIARATEHAQAHGHQVVTGYTTTAALIETVDVLLEKRGGYLSNDILPPWVLLDNVPNWEFGVLTQVRDLARAMRNDFSRSQTQSTEDLDLSEADPLFHYDNGRWIPPDTEGRYRNGMKALEAYLTRLSSPSEPSAQFYARADNLTDWLAIVEKRLGAREPSRSRLPGPRSTTCSTRPAARPGP